SKPRRLLGKKKNLVPAKRKRSKLSYLNGRRVSLDDSGRFTLTFQLGAGRTGPGVRAAWSPLRALCRRLQHLRGQRTSGTTSDGERYALHHASSQAQGKSGEE